MQLESSWISSRVQCPHCICFVFTIYFQFIMDWTASIICQQATPENLSCPQTRHNYDAATVCNAFLQNVEGFCKINALPVNVHYGGKGTAEHFVRNKASWHRSCHQKFNKSKLERQINFKKENEKNKTRCQGCDVQRQSVIDAKCVCIFCETTRVYKLHKDEIFSADQSIRQMATDQWQSISPRRAAPCKNSRWGFSCSRS